MIEFSLAQWQIISPLGTFDKIGDDLTGRSWRPVAEKCDAGSELRVDDQDLPETDGLEIHPHFRSGYKLRLVLQPFDSGGIAIGQARREMWEELAAHLEAIRQADGRIQWTPTGYAGGDRILDNVRLIEMPPPSGGVQKEVAFAVASRFPYYIDLTQQDIALPATVSNPGNANFAPVVKVHGPITTGFTITSTTDLADDGNPRKFVYDTSLIGAPTIASGHYIEIDFFRCTATLDGNVNFTPEAGIDWTQTDFFRILAGTAAAPTANVIGFTGDGTAELLFNPAWV